MHSRALRFTIHYLIRQSYHNFTFSTLHFPLYPYYSTVPFVQVDGFFNRTAPIFFMNFHMKGLQPRAVRKIQMKVDETDEVFSNKHKRLYR